MITIRASTKDEARAAGLPHYFTGKACRRGHLDMRSTSSGHCVACNRERTMEWRARHRAEVNERARRRRNANPERARESSRKWATANPEKERERWRKRRRADPERSRAESKAWREANLERSRTNAAAWRKANPERALAHRKAWAEANPDKIKLYAARSRLKHRDKRLAKRRKQQVENYARVKAWRARNPELVQAQHERWRQDKARIAMIGAARRARKRLAMPAWLSQVQRNAIKVLYQSAKAAGLTIDHIVPLDGCRVCEAHGLHVPWNLQTLSFADNSAKRNRCDDCWKSSC